MECLQCKKENRKEAKFCKWCGEVIIPKTDDLLKEVVGMEMIKKDLQELIVICDGLLQRAISTGVKVQLSMDMVIIGNTGTGKSTLVNAIQQLLYAKGIIRQPRAMIVDAVDYDEFSKKSEKIDNLKENLQKAQGGLLVIENAHKLLPRQQSNEINKLDKLFLQMNQDFNRDPIIILSGLSGLKSFMLTNPDVANRFEYHFDLSDFSLNELTAICDNKLKEYGLFLTNDAQAKLIRIFKYELRNKKDDFGNGHFARQKAIELFTNAIRRDPRTQSIEPEDVTGVEFHQKSYEQILDELDEFVGIDEIKDTIRRIVDKLAVQAERNGTNKREMNDHFLFLGNPGTGKTTIARKFADILNSLDILPIGQLIEVSRKDLVAGYVGQTAIAVEQVVQRAMGGVLFIDEAYSLIQNEHDSFGKEAIDTLLKLMEDYRGKLVVIAAGYSKEMTEFLSTNSGMSSRFNETIYFKDYNATELMEIFCRMVKKEGLCFTQEAEKNLPNFFMELYLSRNERHFGNAREVRNIFNKALKNQGIRLSDVRNTSQYNPNMLYELTREDIEGKEKVKDKDIHVILAELNDFIGMHRVKEEIHNLANKLLMDKKMMELGYVDAELTPMHIILTGNPGTGKTTIATKLGEIFQAVGLLASSKVIIKEPKDVLSSIKNQTAINMSKACDEAMGGTLFIDEAYNLAKIDALGQVDEVGSQAVDVLMTRMSHDAGKFVVVIAGYKDKIEQFIRKANPGLERRFTMRLHIDDYTGQELMEIFLKNASKSGLKLTDHARTSILKLANQLVESKSENFGNAGDILKILSETKIHKANRLAKQMEQGIPITKAMFTTIEQEDIPYMEPKSIDMQQLFDSLNELVGLQQVKNDVKEIADYVRVERAKAKAFGKKYQGLSDHYLFVGNPGTGKTTVARLMADIFYALDVLPTNKLIETSREDFVGAYQGHSAKRTKEVFLSAMGGILFIDEAYALKQSDGDSFGQEAIDTLLKLMEDKRGKIICIAAGYPKEINRWIRSNSGLQSRFNKVIQFEDYTGEELADIFKQKLIKDQLQMTRDAEEAIRSYFQQIYEMRDQNFGNAREVNHTFIRVKTNQSMRIRKRMDDPDFDINEFKQLTIQDMLL